MKILPFSLCSFFILGLSSCSWLDSLSEFNAQSSQAQEPRDYHDDDYWAAHDIKFIVLSIPPYILHEEALSRFINRVKAAPVSVNAAKRQEEFSVSGDGVAPAKRFVLDRSRQWLLVFENRSADAEESITCYRRIEGQLEFSGSKTLDDLGLTSAEWQNFSKVGSNTIDKMGIFD